MREAGLLFRLKVKWLSRKPMCESDGHDFSTAGLREIHPIVQIYAFGMLASIAIFCAEFLIARIQQIKSI